jgi:hypothetical protein
MTFIDMLKSGRKYNQRPIPRLPNCNNAGRDLHTAEMINNCFNFYDFKFTKSTIIFRLSVSSTS